MIRDDENILTGANLVPLGVGFAIGVGTLILLISLWPIFILAGAGYFIHKGLTSDLKDTSGAKDAE